MSQARKVFRWFFIIIFAFVLGIALILHQIPEDMVDFFIDRFARPRVVGNESQSWLSEDFIDYFILVLTNVLIVFDSYVNKKKFSKKMLTFLQKVSRTALERAKVAKSLKISVSAIIVTVVFTLYTAIKYTTRAITIQEFSNLSRWEILDIILLVVSLYDLWWMYISYRQLSSRRKRFLRSLENDEDYQDWPSSLNP